MNNVCSALPFDVNSSENGSCVVIVLDVGFFNFLKILLRNSREKISFVLKTLIEISI